MLLPEISLQIHVWNILVNFAYVTDAHTNHDNLLPTSPVGDMVESKCIILCFTNVCKHVTAMSPCSMNNRIVDDNDDDDGGDNDDDDEEEKQEEEGFDADQ